MAITCRIIIFVELLFAEFHTKRSTRYSLSSACICEVLCF
jgi:hypothetical protein